jgi:flagellar motor switch protein FliM
VEKILSQEEIDALVHKAQRGGAAEPSMTTRQPKVTLCNFRQAGLVSREQLRSVSMLHDTFAKNLTHSLGAYLRGEFEVNLVSVEQLTFSEFLQHVPEVNYVISVNLRPLDALAAVELDLPLAFPIIDLLLGGNGRAKTEVREVTEIEEEILGSVMQVICRELQTTWQPVLQLDFQIDQRQKQAQILRLMTPNERILSLSFEIRMSEVGGLLNVAFPAVASNALLRKLAQEGSYRKHRGVSGGSLHLRDRLERCRLLTELVLPPSPISARELLNMRVGQVLPLLQKIGEPALFTVAGRPLFSAQPVRTRSNRSAEIVGRKINPLETKDKNGRHTNPL